MATEFSKRIAQIFIDDKQAQPSLKSLTAESRKLNAELSRMAPNTKEFAEKAKLLQGVKANIANVRGEIAGTNGVLGSLKGALGPLSGMMAGALGGAAVLAAARQSIAAFHESEKAVAQVGTALKNMGDKAGVTLDELTAGATALEKTSLFSDEEILTQATTQLINFGTIAGDNLTRAQGAAVDMAAAMNGDLQGAAMAVGKALNDPVNGLTALQRAGVKFTEDQKAVIKGMMDTGDAAGAQAYVLEQLEKRYRGQAEAQADAMGGMRDLQVAFDALAEGVGGTLNEALNDVTGGLADLVNWGMDWLGLVDKQSDKVQEQRIEMNALFGVLRAGNITTEQQADLVERLNSEYSDYLPTLLDVNMGEEELARLQRDANNAMLERIELLAKQELLQEAADRLKDAQKEALQTQLDLNRAAQGGATNYEKFKATMSSSVSPVAMFAQANMRARMEAVEAEKAYTLLAERLGDVAKAGQKASQTPGPLLPSAEELERIRKEVADVYKGMDQDRMSAEEKELADNIAWRNELLDAAKESENDQVLIIQAAQDNERAIRAKYAKERNEKAAGEMRKLNETLAGIALEHQTAQLVRDAQELAKVEEKYRKLRELAKGHSKEMAEVERLEAEELAALRAEQALRQQAEADAVAQTVEAERLANTNTRLQNLQAQHALELEVLKQQGLDTTELLRTQALERAPLEEELRLAQLAALDAHYEELYAKADAAGQSTAELQRLHGEALALLNQGFNTNAEQQQAGHDANMLKLAQARRQAEVSIANNAVAIFGSLLQLAADNEEEWATFQKAVTLAQIAIDTASAISTVTAKGFLSSLDPVVAVAKIVGTVAFVLGQAAKAKSLLSSANAPKSPSFAVPTGAASAPSGEQGPQEFAEGGYTTHQHGGWVRGPKVGLIGEAGPEYVSPYRMVSHPTLAPVYNWLEAIRTGQQSIPRFAAGGLTSRGTALVNATAPGSGGSTYLFQKGRGGASDTGDNGALIAVLNRLSAQLSQPIQAQVTYDQLTDATDRMNTIEAESQLR